MESIALAAADKPARYRELLPQLAGLLEGEPDLIANLANTAAALRECVPAASWIGFYIARGGELVLGPFQGKVACVRIALGRGAAQDADRPGRRAVSRAHRVRRGLAQRDRRADRPPRRGRGGARSR